MVVPTRSAPNSLAKDSRILMASNSGARLAASGTPTSTTIPVVTVGELTNVALYTVATPGKVEVLSTSVAANIGKTANVTNITGTTLTVDADFSAFLAAGDIISVVPPPSVELFMPPTGHTLRSELANDYTRGLNQTFVDQNTPMAVTVDGDVPFFQVPNSEAFVRALAYAFGAYKTPSSGTHKFRFIKSNDGSFTAMKDAVFMAQDGNGVIRRDFFGLFATKLVLDYPEGGLAMATLSNLGNGSDREIGGTGKNFPTGTKATRTVADAVFNGTTTVTSATAAFTNADVGASVVSAGNLAVGTTIVSVTNGTTIVVSVAALTSSSAQSLTISTYNYIRTNLIGDTGTRLTFRGAFIDLGGTFGAALSATPLTSIKNLNIAIEKGAISDKTLGDATIMKPDEAHDDIVITGTAVLDTNTFQTDADGQATDASPDNSAKTETRVLLKVLLGSDVTKTLSLDMPRCVVSMQKVRRQEGRFLQDFEIRALATPDATTGIDSTTTPIVEATLVSAVTKNIGTTI